MSDTRNGGAVLTLEPLLEAVREGLQGAGWELSGLQKTTSYEFEGRWAGESSRSAYLFFHREGIPDSVSIDVFLDETSRGLKGNLALVLDGPELGEVGEVQPLLRVLGALAAGGLPRGYQTPITVRCRLRDPEGDPADAEVEYRFKLQIPREAMKAGSSAVSALAGATARAFEELLGRTELAPFFIGG